MSNLCQPIPGVPIVAPAYKWPLLPDLLQFDFPMMHFPGKSGANTHGTLSFLICIKTTILT